MPLPIQIGSVTQALQRAFGFKGRYTPMLDEVIVPVYVISDPAPAQVTRLAAGFNTVNMPSNEIGFVQLFNPPGSGVILNVTSVVVLADAKDSVAIALFDDTTGTTFDGSEHFRDTRVPGPPAGQIGQNATLVSFVGNRLAIVQVDGTLAQTASWETQSADPRQPLVVLDEGKGLIAQVATAPTVNSILLSGNFRWLEIPITEQRPAGGLP